MSVEDIVRELADREAIRELTAIYCHLVWKDDASGIAELFVDDCEFRIGDAPPLKGREAVRAMYAQGGRIARPFVHHNVIRLAGDRATGTCELDLRTVRDGKHTLGTGTYDDVYVRVRGSWRFQSRWYHPDAGLMIDPP